MFNSLVGMTLPTGGPNVAFYESWQQYLSPIPHIFLTVVMLFMHSIALIFTIWVTVFWQPIMQPLKCWTLFRYFIVQMKKHTKTGI